MFSRVFLERKNHCPFCVVCLTNQIYIVVSQLVYIHARKTHSPEYNVDPQFIQILSVLGFGVILCLHRALTIYTWLLPWFSQTVLHILHPQILPLRLAMLRHIINFAEGQNLWVVLGTSCTNYIWESNIVVGRRLNFLYKHMGLQQPTLFS